MIKNNIALNQLVIRTPLLSFNEIEESQIYLKPENLQQFGSYKIRGVVSVIKNSEPLLLSKGLSAASAGNMGQAIAFVARQLAIPCHIYVPDTTPQIKKDRIKKSGANLHEKPFEAIWQIVRGDISPSTESIFIHPVFSEALLAGYEAIAYEIIEDLPDLDAIIIPFGVGGLSIAISRVIHQYNPKIAIYTCEPETAAPMYNSLRQGKPTSVSRIVSFVDAIGTPEVLPAVFQQLSPFLTDSIVVNLESVKQAVRTLLFNNKLLCEGASACSLAAGLNILKEKKHRKIVCLLTGGNLAGELLQELLASPV
ncbi:pyridoxal-phosphate dependent enzyme [Legionella fairfieldensis]|uniref:pyridoxal-phosphate dependent enzyme n=1 Tax=Legionella fairfieldensis TaxID=45064 RepID=UPI0004917C2B|nr:pyridoxal-phosphate dependent enzyme [Legionella fairfieldensis]